MKNRRTSFSTQVFELSRSRIRDLLGYVQPKNSLIPSAAREGVASVAAVTFDEAVMAAEKEEQRMKHLEEPKAAYIGTGARQIWIKPH